MFDIGAYTHTTIQLLQALHCNNFDIAAACILLYFYIADYILQNLWYFRLNITIVLNCSLQTRWNIFDIAFFWHYILRTSMKTWLRSDCGLLVYEPFGRFYNVFNFLQRKCWKARHFFSSLTSSLFRCAVTVKEFPIFVIVVYPYR